MKSFKIVISPSKSLSNIKNENCRTFSHPRFIEKSVSLVNLLKKISPKDLGLLMGISP
ncbi:MAG: YaaA family protein, partial [Bacteroidales bacterium]